MGTIDVAVAQLPQRVARIQDFQALHGTLGKAANCLACCDTCNPNSCPTREAIAAAQVQLEQTCDDLANVFSNSAKLEGIAEIGRLYRKHAARMPASAALESILRIVGLGRTRE